MDAHPRVAVIGLGAIGSMTLRALARRGIAAVGYEQFAVGHSLGASGGETRITRTATVEDGHYIPAILRSRELYGALEQEMDTELLYRSGVLTTGHPDSDLVKAVLANGREHGLDYEVLEPAEIAKRYPQHILADSDVAVFDHLGGLIRTADSIIAAARSAVAHGAVIRSRTKVTAIEPRGASVVVTADGEDELYDKVIVAAGPWFSKLLPELPIKSRRSELTWFATTGEYDFNPSHFPPTLRGRPPGADYSTGLKRAYDSGAVAMGAGDGRTIKFGGNITIEGEELDDSDVDTASRSVPLGHDVLHESRIETYYRGVYPSVVRSEVFFEGQSPDGQPLVGDVPGLDGVGVLGGFSGHGFKLAPFYGELGADLALGVPFSELDASRFAIDRFTTTGTVA